MDEKKINDKSFEREKQQKRKRNPAFDDSQPAMSYREVRAKSGSSQKKKKQTDKGNQRPKGPNQGTSEKQRSLQGQQKKRNNTSSDVRAEDDKIHKNQQSRSENNRPQSKQKQGINNQQSQRKNPQKGQIQQSRNSPKAERPILGEKKKQKQEPVSTPKGNASVHKETEQSAEKTPKKESETYQNQLHTASEIDVKAKKEKSLKPLKPAKPFSPKKRRRKILAVYSSMVLIILLIATFLCLTVFFKIDSVSVEGETRYSIEDIVKASGISTGTNLLLCDTDSGIDVIKKEFPYIENVAIRKNPFNSVTIFVEEAKPATAVETNGKFYILSANGKIIEILDSNKYNVPLIKGAELEKTELSATIEYKLEGMNDIINEITETLKSNEISNVSTIDVTNPSNIKLSYDKRLTIIIGMPENIDYKIKTAKILINEKLEKDSKGTVDVSMCAEGGKYSYYDPSGAPER